MIDTSISKPPSTISISLTRLFDYVHQLLQDETQYITWSLVFIGWVLTLLIAYFQYRGNCNSAKDASYNEWVRELTEKLKKLEDEALLFWTTDSNNLSDSLVISKFTRNVKEITTIARDIKKVGGVEYPKQLFLTLRQSVTNDKELSDRPLMVNHYRIDAIRNVCSDIRRTYRRKGD